MTNLAPFDAADYLDDEETIAEYLTAALEDADPGMFFALAKVDRLDLLFELFEVDCLQIVPSVLGEIQVNLQEGRLFAQKVLDLIAQGKLEVMALTDVDF